MPTYSYECKKCGQPFEAFQQMSDNAFEKCPQKNCNGRVKRIITGGQKFILKGNGWYKEPPSEKDERSDKNE